MPPARRKRPRRSSWTSESCSDDLLHFTEEVESRPDEDLPRVRQGDAAAVAVEEGAPKLPFEQADLPADGGLGDV